MACTFGQLAKAAGDVDVDGRGIKLFSSIKQKQIDELMAWYYANASEAGNRPSKSVYDAMYSATHHFMGFSKALFPDSVGQYLQPIAPEASEVSA